MTDYMQGEIIAIDPDGLWRVVLEQDEVPMHPFDDSDLTVPIVRFGHHWSRERDMSLAGGVIPESALWAYERFAGTGKRVELWQRYMRAFHGTTSFLFFSTSEGTYIALDTATWRHDVGLETVTTDHFRGDVERWSAYCDGDCFRFLYQSLYEVRETPMDEGGVEDRWTEYRTRQNSWTIYGDTSESVLEQAHDYLEMLGVLDEAVWYDSSEPDKLKEISAANASKERE